MSRTEATAARTYLIPRRRSGHGAAGGSSQPWVRPTSRHSSSHCSCLPTGSPFRWCDRNIVDRGARGHKQKDGNLRNTKEAAIGPPLCQALVGIHAECIVQDRPGGIRNYIDQAIGVPPPINVLVLCPGGLEHGGGIGAADGLFPSSSAAGRGDAGVSCHRHAWPMVSRQRALAHSPVRALPFGRGVPRSAGAGLPADRASCT